MGSIGVPHMASDSITDLRVAAKSSGREVARSGPGSGQNVFGHPEGRRPLLIDDLEDRVELGEGATSVHLGITFENGAIKTRKAALIAFSFEDEEGRPVPPVGPFAESEAFGPFFYLHADGEPSTVVHTRLAAPETARYLIIRGKNWLSENPVELSEPVRVLVERPGADSSFVDPVGRPRPVPVDTLRATYPVEPGVRQILTWKVEAAEGSQALLIFRYLDDDAAERMPGAEFQIHPEHGPYVYAVGQRGETAGSVAFQVPQGVTRVEVTGKTWTKGPVLVTDRPALEAASGENDGGTDASILEYVRSIPDTDRVVVVYTTAGPISLNSSLLLRSNRLAMEYARAGWHVVFLPFSEPPPDESGVIAERVLQVGRGRLNLVMDALLARRGPNNVLLCSSFADMTMVATVDRCHDHGWRVIYEVRDDMEEFRRVGFSTWYDQNLEARVARRADALLAVSPRLRDKMVVITGRQDVELVPNAAPDVLIESAAWLRTADSWVTRMRARKVGYIGHLTASWFDWDWLLACADELHDIDFEIVGHGMPEAITLPSNVRYLGPKTHDECLAIVSDWQAGLIPFKISRLTYGVDPNKAYEYVAMGLRCVSAPMGQVELMPGVLTYTSQSEMSEAIREAVSKPLTEDDLAEFEQYLSTASWSVRAQAMLAILEGR
jgi:hypothetical protein